MSTPSDPSSGTPSDASTDPSTAQRPESWAEQTGWSGAQGAPAGSQWSQPSASWDAQQAPPSYAQQNPYTGTGNGQNPADPAGAYGAYGAYGAPSAPAGYAQKSKIVAGILGILLGTFGVHNFYLGRTTRAVVQLLITVISFGALAVVSTVWGLVEGVLILVSQPGTTWHQDGRGVELSD